jgi:hypothetical protein
MKTPIEVSEDDLRDAIEGLQGICVSCGEFGCDNTAEPDAERYTCESCGKPTVYGAEQALLMGLITIR